MLIVYFWFKLKKKPNNNLSWIIYQYWINSLVVIIFTFAAPPSATLCEKIEKVPFTSTAMITWKIFCGFLIFFKLIYNKSNQFLWLHDVWYGRTAEWLQPFSDDLYIHTKHNIWNIFKLKTRSDKTNLNCTKFYPNV